MVSWNIKQHEWESCEDKHQRCKHCNSVLGPGLGTDFVFRCNERFNYIMFQQYLDYNNLSKIKNISKYVKRFTNIISLEKDIIKQYKQILS